MQNDWWWDSLSNLGSAVATAAVFYAILIAATRLSGLRAYSKMSGFDFPLTVAVGSLVASTILTPDPPVVRAAVILGAVLGLQACLAWLRSRFVRVRRLVDNQPLALMRDGRVLEENMARARVSLPELREKIREANALSLDRVRAVVLETTGDVTVIHGDEGELPDPWIMEDVRGWDDAAEGGVPAHRVGPERE